MELLKGIKAKIKVVGVGGAGNNTITRLKEAGIQNVELIAVNTDAQQLLATKADRKILIGWETTRGCGSGRDPKIGEAAAKESEHVLKKALEGSDMVFVTCGLGGGTGTGAGPVIADIAKKLGALVVGVVTLPFSVEGRKTMQKALEGLRNFSESVDTLIPIPNDKLVENMPDTPLPTAFRMVDEVLVNAIKGISDITTRSGLINVDFADVRAIMKDGGFGVIGLGESDSENRAEEAVNKALSHPLLKIDISGAKGALINITGGKDMTVAETKTILEAISKRLDPEAKMACGAVVEEGMEKKLRVLIIVVGVKPVEIEAYLPELKETISERLERELGIEFVK